MLCFPLLSDLTSNLILLRIVTLTKNALTQTVQGQDGICSRLKVTSFFIFLLFQLHFFVSWSFPWMLTPLFFLTCRKEHRDSFSVWYTFRLPSYAEISKLTTVEDLQVNVFKWPYLSGHLLTSNRQPQKVQTEMRALFSHRHAELYTICPRGWLWTV